MLVRRPKNKDDFVSLQPGFDFRGAESYTPAELPTLTNHEQYQRAINDMLMGGTGVTRIDPHGIYDPRPGHD